MTPEEIAEKIITVRKNGNNNQWAVCISRSYLNDHMEGGVILGGIQNSPDVASKYARMFRSVFEQVISEIVNECIDAANAAEVEGVTDETKRAISSAIHKRFSTTVN